MCNAWEGVRPRRALCKAQYYQTHGAGCLCRIDLRRSRLLRHCMHECCWGDAPPHPAGRKSTAQPPPSALEGPLDLIVTRLVCMVCQRFLTFSATSAACCSAAMTAPGKSDAIRPTACTFVTMSRKNGLSVPNQQAGRRRTTSLTRGSFQAAAPQGTHSGTSAAFQAHKMRLLDRNVLVESLNGKAVTTQRDLYISTWVKPASCR